MQTLGVFEHKGCVRDCRQCCVCCMSACQHGCVVKMCAKASIAAARAVGCVWACITRRRVSARAPQWLMPGVLEASHSDSKTQVSSILDDTWHINTLMHHLCQPHTDRPSHRGFELTTTRGRERNTFLQKVVDFFGGLATSRGGVVSSSLGIRSRGGSRPRLSSAAATAAGGS